MNMISFPSPGPSGNSLLTALHSLRRNSRALAGSMERLATGYRINRGADDPAGLIASENLRAQLVALEAESRRLERSDYVIATADAALGEVSDLLIEAEALVVANANGAGLSDEEQAANQAQIDAILSTVNRITGSTSFNGDNLLDGTATVTAGDASLTIDEITIGDIGEGEDAQAALASARDQVTTLRGKLGAFSRNTIGSRLNSIGVAAENVAAAESIIRDLDYAFETANMTRLLLLNSASMASLKVNSAVTSRIVDLFG